MTLRVAPTGTLPPGFPLLRDAALQEGWRHLRVLEEDLASGAMPLAAPGEGMFAAWRDDSLAGLGALTRDPYAAEEGVARVRRLYVMPGERGQGIGRALVQAVMEAATTAGYRQLRVRAPASAGGFYEACGFVPMLARSATHLRVLG